MSEELLIRQGAPTLAGLKTGNLFTCPYDIKEDFLAKIRIFNRILSPKGVRVIPLRYLNRRALIYVYRPKLLCRDLTVDVNRDLLQSLGYSFVNAQECIVQLVERLHKQEEFPHEIGLFLGYPNEDVQGFIRDRKCCKCVGCWKVYGDEEHAKNLFDEYERCTQKYGELWADGSTIAELTMAV